MKKKISWNDAALQRKGITTVHVIIPAARLWSFFSPRLYGICVLLYRKYRHKNLVDLILKLGLCKSYYVSRLLEISAIQHVQPDLQEYSVCL